MDAAITAAYLKGVADHAAPAPASAVPPPREKIGLGLIAEILAFLMAICAGVILGAILLPEDRAKALREATSPKPNPVMEPTPAEAKWLGRSAPDQPGKLQLEPPPAGHKWVVRPSGGQPRIEDVGATAKILDVTPDVLNVDVWFLRESDGARSTALGIATK